MVDYDVVFYGNEGQIERKKEVIRTLRKHYPQMRHNPVIARAENCVIRVSDYDRVYFEDYASKCLSLGLGSWLKSKAGVIGFLLNPLLNVAFRFFGFKGFKPKNSFPEKEFGLEPASQVVSLLVGRHEDDYFNLIPHSPKPKGMVKHPERFDWSWRTAKGHAWLYGQVPPEGNPTKEEMKKLNDKIKRKYLKQKGQKVQRV